jgi:hypothetical protein
MYDKNTSVNPYLLTTDFGIAVIKSYCNTGLEQIRGPSLEQVRRR